MTNQTIGGVQGSGGTGLVDGTFDTAGADANSDKLILGPTNGASNGSGATGYKVVISDSANLSGFAGTVDYRDVVNGPLVEFDGFDLFSFTNQVPASNGDLVDATAATRGLTLDTGRGNDTVNFGSGDDTFVIGNRDFDSDVTDGGTGHDTLDLSAVTGAGRSPFTFSGTNLFQTTAYRVERTDKATQNVTFSNFEAIKSGGGDDVFTGGYAAQTLKSVEMGAGNDVFGWLTFNGTEMDIDAGRGNDTINIGGNSGSGRTGLIDGTVDGGIGTDTLVLGATNGHFGATGFKVVITDAVDRGAFKGTVAYTNGTADGLGGVQVDFDSIEAFTFSGRVPATNNDHVDATQATNSLTLDTGAGNDTVNFGSGNDTFVIGNRKFGADITDGGAGHDTLDLSAVTGAGRSPFTFSGTNLFQTTAYRVERTDDAAHSVIFSDFEAIKSGGGDDVFTGGYAAQTLKSVDLGAGDDVFGWLTFNGTGLNIDAGRGNDTVAIGGNSGSGRTGLIDGKVYGGLGTDTLVLGATNGHFGATGFKVVITDDEDRGAFAGTVAYTNGTKDGLRGVDVTFDSIEAFSFTGRVPATNNDHVDATQATNDLTLDTGAGNDTVNFGSGDDTFVISSRGFGADVTDGGAGHDTLDLSAVTGAGRSPFTFTGTNLFQKTDYTVERTDNETQNVTFSNFEAIKSGGGDDAFNSGYAARALKSVDLGAGNDVFGWSTFNGAKLDIDGGRGDDTIAVGGTQGSNSTGLIDGNVNGGIGTDTLLINYTNDRGTGFEVIFSGDTEGTVTYREAVSSPTTTFESIEKIEFGSFNRRNDLNDRVDASASTAALTIDTAAGDDTIIVGAGKDTVTGGQGADQFVFNEAGDWFGKDKITDFDAAEGDDLVGLLGVSAADITQNGDWVQIRADNGVLLLQDATKEGIEAYFTDNGLFDFG